MADRAVTVDDLVDREGLRAVLAERLGPADRFTVERHTAGHSNETLFLTWGDRELVLRRPPPGETAETAHDVIREFTVIDALQGTAVPVPPTVAACEDESVIGSPFMLMDRVAGDVVRSDEPARFRTATAREQIGRRFVETLAALHGVDYDAVGLGEFGRPTGYLERQVELWTDQLEGWLLPRTDRPVPGARAVGDWLAATVPDAVDHTLVHGDYKLDNVMFGPGEDPTIVAVFDWEMSTLGDPLADLAYLLLYWRSGTGVPDLPDAVTAGVTARAGYPTRATLVEWYEELTGRPFENRRFYRALAAYKLATATEAFYYRAQTGQSDDPLHAEMADVVPALVAHARAIIDGDRSLA